MSEREVPADVAILVRLPRELRDRLAARAVLEDRSTAAMIRVAARRYLATPPDIERLP